MIMQEESKQLESSENYETFSEEDLEAPEEAKSG